MDRYRIKYGQKKGGIKSIPPFVTSRILLNYRVNSVKSLEYNRFPFSKLNNGVVPLPESLVINDSRNALEIEPNELAEEKIRRPLFALRKL